MLCVSIWIYTLYTQKPYTLRTPSKYMCPTLLYKSQTTPVRCIRFPTSRTCVHFIGTYNNIRVYIIVKSRPLATLDPPCSIHKNTTLNRQVRKRAGTARRRQRFDTNYSREFKCLNYLLLFPVQLGCFILTTTGTIIIIILIRRLRAVYGTCENTFYCIYI